MKLWNNSHYVKSKHETMDNKTENYDKKIDIVIYDERELF